MNAATDLAPSRAGGLRLGHRVLVAAGGAGYGGELLEMVGDLLPAAIVTRAVSRAGTRGSSPPRLAQLPHGLLSSTVADPGLDTVLRRQSPRWAASPVPIIVSICADRVDDIAYLARALDQQPEVAGLELDLACPDRARGGQPIGLDPEIGETATVAARAATDLPLVVKLTAAAPDLGAVAKAVAAAGADAISATARLPGLALEHGRAGPWLGSGAGGLSGPALKPFGLRATWEIAQAVRIPVIGIGGVHCLDDVLDYLAAGASAVGLATAALADPELPGRLALELEAWCRWNGVPDQRELIGQALPRRSSHRRERPQRPGR